MPFPSFSQMFNQGSSYSSVPTENSDAISNSSNGSASPETESGDPQQLEMMPESAPPGSKSNNTTPNTQRKSSRSNTNATPMLQAEDTAEILYSNRASLNVGQVFRYKITYTPPELPADSKSSADKSLWLKVKNIEVVALRAAFLAGPFILYVDVRPEDYDQDTKAYSTADQPMYEPQLKPGQAFYAELFMNKNVKQYTWYVDVVSQIIFSNTAQVQFEVSVGTSKDVLHHSLSEQNNNISQSSCILVNRQDTLDLWHTPTPKSDKPLHLVVVTHGLHSNTGADMLYLKESIDKAARISGENIIVRGYFGNVRKTEKGIKYLGKRLAEYIVHELAPENPGVLPPVEKISFIGHSLGGLVQTFAIAFIAVHYPNFFERVQPVNFICLASPLLGISNENPGYVKFALDLGFVGKSGQDLGLTRKPTLPGKHSKPLLQILPTGPTHKILLMFKHRTIYANAVNDGIVPLRTSALLYLDWNGLYKVEKAKRGEDTGTSPTHVTDEGPPPGMVVNPKKYEMEHPGEHLSLGPSSKDDAVDGGEEADYDSPVGKIPDGEDDPLTTGEISNDSSHTKESGTGIFGAFSNSVSQPVQSMFSFFAPHAGVHKPPKIYSRGQTRAAAPDDIDDEAHNAQSSASSLKTIRAGGDQDSKTSKSNDQSTSEPQHFKTNDKKKFLTATGDTILVPKKTSVFEAGVSVLLPPLPSQTFIMDPASRPSTIFHDRIYHDYDLPPPRLRKQSSMFNKKDEVVDKSKMEEKMAREWHRDMSWRKVLVRLEPDAHNNIIVRRRFANAYGWPVIDHLVKNHFAGEPTTPTTVSSAASSISLRNHVGISGHTLNSASNRVNCSPMDIIWGNSHKKSTPSEKELEDKAEGKDKGSNKTSDKGSKETSDKKDKSIAKDSEVALEAEKPADSNIDTQLPTSSSSDVTSHNLDMLSNNHSRQSTNSSTDSSGSSNNKSAWQFHLDKEGEDSEDEGLLFTMGNVFDNIREIGNFNFNALSLGGNDTDKYAQVSTSDSSRYEGGHTAMFEDSDEQVVGYADTNKANGTGSQAWSHQCTNSANYQDDDNPHGLEDEFSMYGPLNGDSIEERLAKQGFP